MGLWFHIWNSMDGPLKMYWIYSLLWWSLIFGPSIHNNFKKNVNMHSFICWRVCDFIFEIVWMLSVQNLGVIKRRVWLNLLLRRRHHFGASFLDLVGHLHCAPTRLVLHVHGAYLPPCTTSCCRCACLLTHPAWFFSTRSIDCKLKKDDIFSRVHTTVRNTPNFGAKPSR